MTDVKQGAAPMQVNRPVFFLAAPIALVAGVLSTAWPERSRDWLSQAQGWTTQTFGWFYMLLMITCLIFVFWLAFSRHGRLVLGRDDEKPEIGNRSWVAMLFSSGIGVALLYYGAYEPLAHYLSPPAGPGGTPQAARDAVALTFLHWGLHGWALYALVGTVLAYFAYRRGLPLALRSPLHALVGDRVDGWAGHAIDVLGILATMVAMFTNVGIGVLVVHSGLNYLLGVPTTPAVLIALTLAMMGVATIAVVVGVEKGIASLANANIALLCALLAFVMAFGPTAHILSGLVQNSGDYLAGLVGKSFDLYLYDQAGQWLADWTLFFWAWWIAWTSFVGLFIARISRGRTIRELVLGVTLIPLGFTLGWLSIFGNTAIELVRAGVGAPLAAAVQSDPPMALFRLLEHLPFTTLVAAVTTFACFILFLTPVNSGTLMIANLSMRGGAVGTDAPGWMRLFWAGAITLISLGLLLAGNFDAMQMAVGLCGLPLALVLILYMLGLVKALREEEEGR